MNVVFLHFLVGPFTLAAQTVDVQRIVRQVKAPEPGVLDGVLEVFVLKLRDLATLGANLMMMRAAIVAPFILGGVAKLVLDDQTGIHQQDDGIVERGTADTELLLPFHQRIESVNIEMTLYRIDGVKYGIAFGRLAMSVLIEIFRKYLLDRFFQFVTLTHGRSFLQPTKLTLFYGKQKKRREKAGNFVKGSITHLRFHRFVEQPAAFGITILQAIHTTTHPESMLLTMLHKSPQRRHHGTTHGIGARQEGADRNYHYSCAYDGFYEDIHFYFFQRRKEQLTQELKEVVQKCDYTIKSSVLAVRRSNRVNNRNKKYLKDLSALADEIKDGKRPVSDWDKESQVLKKQLDKDLIEIGNEIDELQEQLNKIFPSSWYYRFNDLIPKTK